MKERSTYHIMRQHQSYPGLCSKCGMKALRERYSDMMMNADDYTWELFDEFTEVFSVFPAETSWTHVYSMVSEVQFLDAT